MQNAGFADATEYADWKFNYAPTGVPVDNTTPSSNTN